VRRALALPLLLAVALGCDTGEGVGAADGTLFALDCDCDTRRTGCIRETRERPRSWGLLDQPAPYSLDPQFFAGEPIEDIKRTGIDNRLVIRLQSSGKRIESNDLLSFDVVSSYEVARCVRGRIDSFGKPDYDTRWCFWGANGEGPPRVRIGPEQPIIANFAPRATCPTDLQDNPVSAFVVATAIGPERLIDGRSVPTPPDEWESWIEFEEFGNAAQRGRAPTARAPVDQSFKVEFDKPIRSPRFHLEMIDDRIPKAPKFFQPPPVRPDIKAVFDGNFDFDLARGQGAQTFP
jgi:hypothetical protein